jgi:nitrate reductase NapAB chaperone NapD
VYISHHPNQDYGTLPISGLVVIFESSDALNDLVVDQLVNHQYIAVGERADDRIAIVVDSLSKEHDTEIWEWINNLPGVSQIQIAFVGFDDDQPQT